ncbi:MAG: M3 family oligoendopeptidase [Pseudobdellovibrionaceae bacterium]
MNPILEKNPSWDISSEYPCVDSAPFKTDFDLVTGKIESIKKLSLALEEAQKNAKAEALVEALQQSLVTRDQAMVALYNMFTFVHCELSVDATHKAAKAKMSELESLSTNLQEAFTKTSLLMIRCDDSVFQKVMAHPELKPAEFEWTQSRKLKPTLLSESEETLTTTLAQSGFSSWGNLYSTLSGTMKVKMVRDGKEEVMGLAQAHALTRTGLESDRRAAWEAIQKGWTEHQETAASILNSIAGWRLDMNRRRSHTKKVHFLDQPCFQARIQKETLEAMMTAIENNIEPIREAATAMAQVLGKKQLDPWDLLAPSPIKGKSAELSYAEGLEQIKSSFDQVDPELGQFVSMMDKNRWIEARVMPNKTTGAYCTGFVKSKTPRVYMTYLGSSNDVSTLAHELGHAYHSWVMRDLPLVQQDYPMTLAETASIFAETLLNETLLGKAQTRNEKLEFAWNAAADAVSLLLNIPARYSFEKSFYEAREHRALSAEELGNLTDKAWSKWYGPALSQNDKLFWAHKLHFSMTGVSFYNFPYAFGYLFSLSIYARRNSLGREFMPKYRALLMDTGRMTAEDCVMKHLGEDIRRPEFWQASIEVVKKQISLFKDLVNAH